MKDETRRRRKEQHKETGFKRERYFMVQTPTKPTTPLTPMNFTKKELIELRHRLSYQSPTPMDSNELQ